MRPSGIVKRTAYDIRGASLVVAALLSGCGGDAEDQMLSKANRDGGGGTNGVDSSDATGGRTQGSGSGGTAKGGSGAVGASSGGVGGVSAGGMGGTTTGTGGAVRDAGVDSSVGGSDAS